MKILLILNYDDGKTNSKINTEITTTYNTVGLKLTLNKELWNLYFKYIPREKNNICIPFHCQEFNDKVDDMRQ